jgi:hypothetical protein
MNRPTMVLLHGVGLDHTMWEPAVALLADGRPLHHAGRPVNRGCPAKPLPRMNPDLGEREPAINTNKVRDFRGAHRNSGAAPMSCTHIPDDVTAPIRQLSGGLREP